MGETPVKLTEKSMNFIKKFFCRKVNVKVQVNDSVTAIELDPTKNYILLVKFGAVSMRSFEVLRGIDPERITVVGYN